MHFLKADTQIKVRIGPFVDVTDGYTPETGVTLGSADEAELLKTNGAATADISGNTWAAIAACDGWYDLTLTAGNLDTEGQLTVVVQDDSVCLPVHKEFMVVNANVYDSLFAAAATDYLQVDTLQVEGSDATDQINAAVDTALDTAIPGAPTANSINERIVAIDTLTEAAGDGDLAAVLADTAEIQGKLPTNKFAGSSDGGDEDANIDAILADTNELQALITANKLPAQVKGIDTDVITADALNTDAVTEIWAKAMTDLAAGAPSATCSVFTAINYLYEAWRNKTTKNATEIQVYKDDAATILCEANYSDDGTTYTRDEMGAED